MLFLLLVKASNRSEADLFPDPLLQEAMAAFNRDLVEAGVRVMAKGLHPTREAVRFSFHQPNEEPDVTSGPFEPSADQLAGFILIDVASREEAITWARRMPDPQGHGEGQIELRQVFE
ncbi:YciI family protein [Exiguobacterium sp. Helios]|uniref:YciI family protein n=1 Tax=Exiguobacterium sp. Helios TaxID=2735868 RepID=UPI00165E8D5F|nr:YciI family protein [Exiguobacterium sp. Helios]QNR21249.1 YciI family protein [Exiguobacterium sp. Helios]